MERKKYLINSTGKYDDLGDRLYFKLMINNAGTLIKAALGNIRSMINCLMKCFMITMISISRVLQEDE